MSKVPSYSSLDKFGLLIRDPIGLSKNNSEEMQMDTHSQRTTLTSVCVCVRVGTLMQTHTGHLVNFEMI